MRLLFAGTPQVAIPALRALIDHPGHEVVAVLTRPDARSGRGRQRSASPVADYACEHGIPVLKPVQPNHPEFAATVEQLDIDLAPVVAYGALLREPLLSLPRLGWVNLHFSILPAWRGAAPVQHAIWHGDQIGGATTFLIGPGLDDGPVYGTVTEAIRPEDTSGQLATRLAIAGARLLTATVDGIAGGSLTPVPQSGDGISLAPKLTVADAHVDFTLPALAVDRQIRACTPQPGAWALFRGERIKLDPVSRIESEPVDPPRPVSGLVPGQLLATRDQVLAGTATGPLRLTNVCPAGKRSMPAADWARGVRLVTGECFV